MTDKKHWTRNETIQLIEKLEQYRELWDTKSKDYRNKIKRNSTLQSLGVQFNTTDTEVGRKIHNLKTQFGQELKKERQRKSGQSYDDIYKSKWEYFDMMKFTLDQHIPAATDDSMDSNSDLGAFIAEEESTCHDTPSVKRPKKSTSQNDNLARASKILDKPDDEYQIFGDYVANEIRNMHFLKYKGQLKRKIQHLVIEMTEIDDNEYLKREETVSSNELRQNNKRGPCRVIDENGICESTYQPSHVVNENMDMCESIIYQPKPGPSNVVDEIEICESIIQPKPKLCSRRTVDENESMYLEINGVRYLIDSLPLGTQREDDHIEQGNTQSQ